METKWIWGNSRGARALRVAVTGGAVVAAIFGLNALVVALAMLRASRQLLRTLVMERLQLKDLSAVQARILLKAAVNGGFAMHMFRVTLEEPLVLHLALSSIAHPPILEVIVPPFEIGKALKHVDFDEDDPITLSLNPDFDLKRAIQRMIDSNGRATFQVSAKVVGSTTSFWIPVRIRRTVTMDYDVDFWDLIDKGMQRSQSARTSSFLESFEVSEHPGLGDAGQEKLQVLFHGKIPHFPAFLTIDLPSLRLQVGIEMESVRGSIGDVHVSPHTLSSTSSDIHVAIETQRAYMGHLKAFIRRLLEGRRDFMFIISAPCPPNPQCHIQRFLRSLHVRQSYEDISAVLGLQESKHVSGSSSASPLQVSKLAMELVKVELVDLRWQRFVLHVGVLKSLLTHVTGFEVGKLRGKLPVIALQNVLSYHHHHHQSNYNADVDADAEVESRQIASVELDHVPDQDPLYMQMRCSIGITDATAFGRLFYEELNKTPSEVVRDVSRYRRLLLTGLDESLLSSLISALAVEVDLTSDFPTIAYHGSRQTPSHSAGESCEENFRLEELAFAGYDFSVPASVPDVTRLDVDVKVTQDADHGQVMGSVKFPDHSTLLNRPFLSVRWPSFDVSIASNDSVLGQVIVQQSSLRMALAPLSPLHLLHQGDIKIDARTSASIVPWRRLIADLTNDTTDAGRSLKLTWSLQEQTVDMTVCLPKLDLMANGFGDPFGSMCSEPYVKFLGFHEQTISWLLRLPKGIGTENDAASFKSRISATVSLPALGTPWILQIDAADSSDGSDDAVNTSEHIDMLEMKLDPMQFALTLDNFHPSKLQVMMGDTFDDWLPVHVILHNVEALLDLALDSRMLNLASLVSCPKSASPAIDRLMSAILESFPLRLSSSVPFPGPIRPWTDSPATLNVAVGSPDWTHLNAKVDLTLPLSNPLPCPSPMPSGTIVAMEWPKTEVSMTCDIGEVRLVLEPAIMSFGPPSSPSSQVSGPTKAVRLDLQIALHDRLTSVDGRRMLHRVYNYVHRDQAIDDLDLVFTIRALDSMNGRPRIGSTTVNTASILKHVKKLLLRPSDQDNPMMPLWKAWRAQVRLKTVDGIARQVQVPCFLPQLCPSVDFEDNYKELVRIEAEVTMLAQLASELIGCYGGLGLRHLALPAYPRHLLVHFESAADILVAASINGVQPMEAVIDRGSLSVSRTAPISYGRQPALEADTELRVRNDRHVVSVALRPLRGIAELGGLMRHVYVDGTGRIELDALPGQGFHYSPLALGVANDRVPVSNLLSTVSALLLQELPAPPIISELVPQDIRPVVTHASPGAIHMRIENVLLRNPTKNIDFVMLHSVQVTVSYHRNIAGADEVVGMEEEEGFDFAKATIGSPTGQYPYVVRAAVETPFLLEAALTFSPQDKDIVQEYVSRISMREPNVRCTVRLEPVPGLTWRMPFRFGPRAQPPALIDLGASGFFPTLQLSFRNDSHIHLAILGLHFQVQMQLRDEGGETAISVERRRSFDTVLALCKEQCRELAMAPTLAPFMQCLRESPAADLPPGRRLLGGERVPGHFGFSFVSQEGRAVGSEQFSGDGLCLSMTGVVSTDVVSADGNGRCHLDIPIALKAQENVRSRPSPEGMSVFGPAVVWLVSHLFAQDDFQVISALDFDPCRLIDTTFVHRHQIVPSLRLNDASLCMGDGECLLLSGLADHPTVLALQPAIDVACTFVIEFDVHLEGPAKFGILLSDTPPTLDFNSHPYAFSSHQNHALAFGINVVKSTLEVFSIASDANWVLMMRKSNATVPRTWQQRWLRVRLVYLAAHKQVVLDVYGCQPGQLDTVVTRSLYTIDRRPPQSYDVACGEKLSLRQALNGADRAFVAVTARGSHRLRVRNVRLGYALPQLDFSRVYWRENEVPVRPGEEDGAFYLQLVTEHHARWALKPNKRTLGDLGQSFHPLRVQLRPFAEAGSEGVVECAVEFDHASLLYRIAYVADDPGRYAIYASLDDDGAEWTCVQWHSVYIRHHW